MKPYPWSAYSHLLVERILNPHHVGFYQDKRGADQEMRIVTGQEGQIRIYLVVDETDGIIADAKFQVFGESALIGAADVLCELLIRKNHEQARRITTELLDKKLRDFDNIPAFPQETSGALNSVLSALECALEKCLDLGTAVPSSSPPVPFETDSEGGHPHWETLSRDEKLELIKQVIAQEIQPYIELDAGGVEVLSFKEEREVVIAYQGACTTCPSATGATLNAIQHILRTKLHPTLVVKPDLSFITQTE